MNFNDYLDITSFNIAFNDSIDAKSELGMEMTLRDDEIFYVMLVNLLHPVWAERQKYLARNSIISPTLSQL